MISLHDQLYNMRERDMAISFKGAHFLPEVILMGVRWYVAYPLSTRHVEEGPVAEFLQYKPMWLLEAMPSRV